MLAMGVDPGYSLGVAVIKILPDNTPQVVTCSTIRSKRQGRIERICELSEAVAAIALAHNPDLCAIEDFIPFRDDNFPGRRKQISKEAHDTPRIVSAIGVKILPICRVEEINPGVWPKQLVGLGLPRTTDRKVYDQSVARTIQYRLGISDEQMKPFCKGGGHQRDAIGIAIYAADMELMAKAHRKSLAK
jgi:hypothetical protein